MLQHHIAHHITHNKHCKIGVCREKVLVESDWVGLEHCLRPIDDDDDDDSDGGYNFDCDGS